MMASTMNSLFRFELRLFVRSRFTLAVLALLWAAMTCGALNGELHVREQQATLERVRLHQAAALAESQAAVVRYRRAGTLLPYWQDPADAAGFMRYALVAHTVKPPSPLGALAIGQSRLLPYYLRTNLDFVAPPDSAYDFVNPRLLSVGDFDFAFVLVYVLPLALIALGAGRLAAERDSGALPLLAAQAPSYRQLVLLKFAVVALVCVPFSVVAGALALLAAGTSCWSMASLPAMLLLAAALAGFTLFWVALTALVASRSGVVGSYLRLISLWMAFTFFVPAGVALALDMAHAAPSRLQFLDDLRRANNLTGAEREALFAAYLERNPQYRGAALRLDQVPYATKQIAVQLAVESQLAQRGVASAHRQAAIARQAAALRWLSPAMVFDAMLQDAAGSGAQRHQDFLRATATYTDELRGFFWPRALREAAAPANRCPGCATRLNFVEHERIPRFVAADPVAGVAQGIAAAAVYPWLLALFTLLMLARTGPFRLR